MRIYTRRPDELKVGQHVKDESTGASFFVTFVGSHYIDLLPIANGGNCAEIIEACQELDTLTVTKLRPMSEAPRDGRYIKVCFYSGSNQYHSELFVRWNDKYQAWEEYMVDPEEETHQDYAFDGFIDIPRYEPEKV